MQLVELEVPNISKKVIGLQYTESITLIRCIDKPFIYAIDEMHADHLGLLRLDSWFVCGGYGLGVGFVRGVGLHFIGIINKVFDRGYRSFLFLFVLFLLLGEVRGIDELLLFGFGFCLDFLRLL